MHRIRRLTGGQPAEHSRIQPKLAPKALSSVLVVRQKSLRGHAPFREIAQGAKERCASRTADHGTRCRYAAASLPAAFVNSLARGRDPHGA